MGYCYKLRSILFAVIAVFFLTGFGQLPQADRFLPISDAEMMKTPDDGHKQIIKLMDQAQSSIHLMIYHLTDPEVIQSLTAAARRGVEVTAILDYQWTAVKVGKAVLYELQEGGVKVVRSSKAFSISHVKAFTVDQKILFISTMNFVKSWALMRDYGLTTQEPIVVNEFEKVFRADLENAKNNTKETPELTSPNMIWSPVNSREKLVQMIDSSQTEIEAQVENLTDAYIIASLGNAAKRGVHVKVMTPQCVFGGAYNNDKGMKMLTEAGADTRVMPPPSGRETPYLHSKTLTVDGKVAYLGSENFSLNSLSYAREAGILFSHLPAIQFVHEGFQKDWDATIKFSSLKPGYCDNFSWMNFVSEVP